ncbi:MAG TPA: hypothetical protein VFV79_09185 [Saprospiraceae bacterium]|nr:hypothetical protein [Saprospiraceae bacterium]
MKNLFFLNCTTTLKSTQSMRYLLIATLFFVVSQFHSLHAQGPRLSIQGILKKANGDAVTDGSYNLTFRLYTTPTGPTSAAVWDEIQTGVDVISGIYSTVLGNDSTLNIAFNQLYYLGVTVGTTEMTPRIQLTSAPYALSLIGNTNQFPSSGQVIADSTKVTWGVSARGGIPVNANGRHQGYTFSGNNGDTDSGMGSTANGQVSLYVNNAEKLKTTLDSVVIKPDLRLAKESNINYNGLDDWRLVEVDNFSGTDEQDWDVYNPLSGEWTGWNNGTSAGNAPLAGDANEFIGRFLRPANNQALKKHFDLTGVGNYNYIKVKFKYYFIDSWNGMSADENNDDAGFAAFAASASGDEFRLGWYEAPLSFEYVDRLISPGNFRDANKWAGNSVNGEFAKNVEMTAYKNSGSDGFWLIFGSTLNNNNLIGNPPQSDESYGVGMIEVWVK